MLTQADIELIKRTRAEITQNRTDSVIIYRRKVVGKDPYSGDDIIEEVPETVEATWRRYTSQSPGSNDIQYIAGVRIETGDVIANFDIDIPMEDVRKVKHVASDETYEIKAHDDIGLGKVNRHYVLLGKVV